MKDLLGIKSPNASSEKSDDDKQKAREKTT